MNKKIIAILLILIFTITAFCGCVNQESTTVDEDTDEGTDESSDEGSDDIIGTWIGTETNNPTGDWTFIFGETTLQVTGPSENYVGTYTTDTSFTPHHLDFHITDCSISGYIGTTTLSIYEVTGDTGRWCGSEPGSPNRPDSYNAIGGRNFDLTRESI